MLDTAAKTTAGTACEVNGTALELYASGVAFWPDERMLVVSDLHLEKGSSFARRGVMLPPYDSAATLERLAQACAALRPRTVMALGDSFHDRDASTRLPQPVRVALAACMAGRNWIWLLGNHDPAPPAGLGGDCVHELTLGSLTFRHEPVAGTAAGEIAGHLHPAAAIRARGRRMRRRCFAGDGTRLVMPAFGAYAGGLDLSDPAFAALFAGPFTAWLMGRGALHAVSSARLARR